MVLSTATPCRDAPPQLQHWSTKPGAYDASLSVVVRIERQIDAEAGHYSSSELAAAFRLDNARLGYLLGCAGASDTAGDLFKALVAGQTSPFHVYPTVEMMDAAAELLLFCHRLKLSCAAHVPGTT